MGPREHEFRQGLDILDDAGLETAQRCNAGVAPVIRRLRLEDGLGEALDLFEAEAVEETAGNSARWATARRLRAMLDRR